MMATDDISPVHKLESDGEELKSDQSQDSSPRNREARTWLGRLADILSGGVDKDHKTQRGMQSRHLMMIGEYWKFSSMGI
jgi:hypothetical protein